MNSQDQSTASITADREMINKTPLGVELTPEESDRLADIVAVLGLKDGDFLLEEGHSDESLYVIVEGRLEVVKSTSLHDYVTLQVLREGEMAGELGFIDGEPHSAGLRALSNCTVFSLERSALESLLKTDPELVYKVMRAIMRTVHGILRKMNTQHVELMNYINKQHGRY